MERDDVIEYSLDNHHSEEEGKKIRKNIYKVTIILSVVTIVEVLMGVLLPKAALGMNSTAWEMVKLGYVILTLLKAGYIVVIFMHLGDERKSLKWTILAPYALFILYLLYILLVEGAS
jgi:cytochrome c oxidase subunit IV